MRLPSPRKPGTASTSVRRILTFPRTFPAILLLLLLSLVPGGVDGITCYRSGNWKQLATMLGDGSENQTTTEAGRVRPRLLFRLPLGDRPLPGRREEGLREGPILLQADRRELR